MYTRTSSATNVDGDSKDRQRLACLKYADAHNMRVVGEASDDAIPGTDHIVGRPGLSSLMTFCENNDDISTILVEKADRFSRDQIIQEKGYLIMKELGITIVCVDAPEFFTLDPTPTQNMIRQILGAVAQFDKDTLVQKMRGARERIKSTGKKCEGRKSVQERHPEVIELIPRMRGMKKRGESLATISRMLYAKGITTEKGNPLTSTQVSRLCQKPQKTGIRTKKTQS